MYLPQVVILVIGSKLYKVLISTMPGTLVVTEIMTFPVREHSIQRKVLGQYP